MATSSLTLTQLPVNDILEILKRCNIESILVLRKTCHDFRNLIDDSKLDIKHLDISVDFSGHSITLTLGHQHHQDRKLSIKYSENEFGCLVFVAGYYSTKKYVREHRKQKRKLLRDENICGNFFVDIFLQDFQIILKTQRNTMKSFYLHLATDKFGFLANFGNFLESNQLKAKDIHISTATQSSILQVLPNFDSKLLETIKMSYPISLKDKEEVWAELIKMEQWKNAKNLEIQNFDLENVKDCLHFSTVKVQCHPVLATGVVMVKQKFLESSSLTNLTISFHEIEKTIYETLGPKYHVEMLGSDLPEFIRHCWYFEIENSRKCLCLELSMWTLKLYYINWEDVTCEYFIKEINEK